MVLFPDVIHAMSALQIVLFVQQVSTILAIALVEYIISE